MPADEQWSQLAHESLNFGFLRDGHVGLLWLAVKAEASAYTSPKDSVASARTFVDLLSKQLLVHTGTHGPEQPRTPAQLLNLTGLLSPSVYAVLQHLESLDASTGAPRERVAAGLEATRCCHQLASWLHRTVHDEPIVDAFVPPAIPVEAPHEVAVRVEETYDRFLQEAVTSAVRVGDDRGPSGISAHMRQRAQDGLLNRTSTLELLSALTVEYGQSLISLEAALCKPAKVPPAEREKLIYRSRHSVPSPVGGEQTRIALERQLHIAGWQVQDISQMNLAFDGGQAVRYHDSLSGACRYLLHVDGMLVGAAVAHHGYVRAVDLAPELASLWTDLAVAHVQQAWDRDNPLPFRYMMAGTITGFMNALDQRPAIRDLFAVHRPETVAHWLHEAENDPKAPTPWARLRGVSKSWPVREFAGHGDAGVRIGPSRTHRSSG